ncbi:hypothetical protein PENSPDRAFT_165113 [Peniophora sp. CONT]|nr:hypothetical protein PENSPDRAFT_165113 [Peniophora sp. CONT]
MNYIPSDKYDALDAMAVAVEDEREGRVETWMSASSEARGMPPGPMPPGASHMLRCCQSGKLTLPQASMSVRAVKERNGILSVGLRMTNDLPDPRGRTRLQMIYPRMYTVLLRKGAPDLAYAPATSTTWSGLLRTSIALLSFAFRSRALPPVGEPHLLTWIGCLRMIPTFRRRTVSTGFRSFLILPLPFPRLPVLTRIYLHFTALYLLWDSTLFPPRCSRIFL